MFYRDSHTPTHTGRQRGAALFMALIFLLILTILGVFGMNISRLENMMAGNTQFQTTALNNAEYILVRGENDIKAIAKAGSGNPFNPDTDGDHYYPIGTTTASGTPPSKPEDLVWTFPSQKVSIPDLNGDKSDTDGDGIFDDGVGNYIVEDAGLDYNKGEDDSYIGLVNPLAGSAVQVFLVTAQSSSSRGAKRTVQSVLVTDPLKP